MAGEGASTATALDELASHSICISAVAHRWEGGARVGKKRRQGSGAGGGEMAGEGASAATADCELDQTDIPMTLPILPFMKLQSMSNTTIFHMSTMPLLLLSSLWVARPSALRLCLQSRPPRISLSCAKPCFNIHYHCIHKYIEIYAKTRALTTLHMMATTSLDKV